MLTCGSYSSRDKKSLKTPIPRLRHDDKVVATSFLKDNSEGIHSIPLLSCHVSSWSWC